MWLRATHSLLYLLLYVLVITATDFLPPIL